jgi:transcriptional regulator with XRE-family HTH domain
MPLVLENRRMAPYFPPAYYLGMAGKAFRDRILQAMTARGLTKAELSRQSGVPYHALDKFLKRDGATTSAENAKAMADALGLALDGDDEYDELRRLYFQLPEEKRQFLLASIRGLLADQDG